MFETLNKYWNDYGFEIVVIISFTTIVILFFVNYFANEKGTYTKNLKTTLPLVEDKNFIPGKKIDDGFTSKLEFQAKIILESIFQRSFLRVRPDFLRNDVTGQNLEIDLYNKDLKLGVEINGDQHYSFTPFFQKNKEAFLNQRYRDEMKKEKCQKEGITLIEVPYSVGTKNLKNYMVEQLRLNQFII